MIALPLLMGAAIATTSTWIAVDWMGKEPEYPPGSLFWRTNEYARCPILYRTVLHIEDKPIEYAVFRASVAESTYVLLNGAQIASTNGATDALDVELTHLLRPGPNALVLSAGASGFALSGRIAYRDGSVTPITSGTSAWRAAKFAPLTLLEDEPCMRPDFDDGMWTTVHPTGKAAAALSDDDARAAARRMSEARLARWDEDARWRLGMLATKGIAVVDWEAHGWGGSGRLPAWVVDAARDALSPSKDRRPGELHELAEALCQFALLHDEANNMRYQAVGLSELGAATSDIDHCRNAASDLGAIVRDTEDAIRAGQIGRALDITAQGLHDASRARDGRLLNGLNTCLDNKFGWFNTLALLDNDVQRWGLRHDAQVYASPLSPAAHVTVSGRSFAIDEWDELQPWRVYNKPAATGPVNLWSVQSGAVVSRVPDSDGVVYDRSVHGALTENWVLLVSDLSRGGPLPTQLVFLTPPERIIFTSGEKGTRAVTVEFANDSAELFVLRPLKEWRGLLGQARTMTQIPLDQRAADPYIKSCRLWSRAVLEYPIEFSEAFLREPEGGALRIADVYGYRTYRDAWETEPLRLAPLPPLASYGLLTGYPGIEIHSPSQVLGSLGDWGDFVAVVDSDRIVYRVPLDSIKRFAGFTSYCFGPTDIGEPGSRTEVDTVRRIGANSFRPQHNQTGERAMRTLMWAWERGLQNVFNTDEKWVPDVVEHYRTLARQCKDLPPDAVAYDLLNEPETREPRSYGALIKKITNVIREVDKTHLIYVEAMPEWGPGAKPFPKGAFETLEPTGDPLTVYSFHDYEFRLPPLWPNEERDIRDILTRWIPAFRYAIDHRVPIHLGEFGGLEQTDQDVYSNHCALAVMADFFRIFDAFGWHFHYYSNRGTVRVRGDGSLQESLVQAAFRRYAARGTLNANR
ncbi:glycoside hydrolase family 5 protein [Candidatus Poribacteria bacterium]|nr:glycoside hydrolase family 5 protein [Candidatus Poribacteria bacterium]